jgi:hypothetical protein
VRLRVAEAVAVLDPEEVVAEVVEEAAVRVPIAQA